MGRPKSENKKTKWIGCRVTESEYAAIARAALDRRQKISTLLREVAVKRIRPRRPLYTIEQAEKFTVELRRISNNLNQIARKVNTVGVIESTAEAREIADAVKNTQADLGRLVEVVRR